VLSPLKEQENPFIPLRGSLSRITDSLFHGCTPCVCILPLAAIDPSGTGNHATWLHPQEAKQLIDFKYNKRSTEWLAGRICAKQSLLFFLQLKGVGEGVASVHRHRIASEESGRPFFHTGSADQSFTYPQLSISHSKEFATALCAMENCGIDIQYQTNSLLKVKEKFLNAAEERLLDTTLVAHSALVRLSLLWAAKEAAKKMLSPTGMPGFHDLHLIEISITDAHSAIFSLLESRRYHAHFAVAVGIQSTGYSIAICCNSNTP
jgi:4'-phosphopantetheinyl transferase EntD